MAEVHFTEIVSNVLGTLDNNKREGENYCCFRKGMLDYSSACCDNVHRNNTSQITEIVLANSQTARGGKENH